MQVGGIVRPIGGPENSAVLDAAKEDRDMLLVRRFVAGDESAFDELVARYQSYVFNICLNMVGNRSDAEDVAQEVFIAIHKGLPRFGMRSRVSTWVYRIVMNQCISHRRGRSAVEVPLDMEIGVHVDHASEIEKRRAVRELLQKIAPHYRAVLVLKYYHELSYEESAEILGWSVEKVKCYLHRARNIFRKHYEESESEGSL